MTRKDKEFIINILKEFFDTYDAKRDTEFPMSHVGVDMSHFPKNAPEVHSEKILSRASAIDELYKKLDKLINEEDNTKPYYTNVVTGEIHETLNACPHCEGLLHETDDTTYNNISLVDKHYSTDDPFEIVKLTMKYCKDCNYLFIRSDFNV